MVHTPAGAWFIRTEWNLTFGDLEHYIQHKTRHLWRFINVSIIIIIIITSTNTIANPNHNTKTIG